MKHVQKANLSGWVAPILVGIILYCLTPIRPAGLSAASWQMFAVFVATIVACISKPLPIGAVTLTGLVVTVLLGLAPVKDVVDLKTGAVTNQGILSAFGNDASWLIAMAFIMAYGITKTGLGNRIAYHMIKLFGKRSLGIAYSITGLELVLGALVPSNSARTGGIVYPVVKSISTTYGSQPNDPSRKKIGAFLDFVAFQANTLSTALFITGAAPNLVAVAGAQQKGYTITWVSWFLAALIPVLVGAIIIPIIVYKMFPPEIKETPNANSWAQGELDKMGAMSVSEKIMTGTFLLAIVMWILSGFPFFAKLPQFNSTFVAFIAVTILLVTRVLSMKDVLGVGGAWNILIWLSVLVFMANKLTTYGFIGWFAKTISSDLHGMPWGLVLVILLVVYFYAHYFFASGTAHVTALYLPFLAVAVASGAPLALAAMLLAFDSAIMSSTTHYANGPASILAASGYVDQKEWWKSSFILGLVYMIIFFGLGSIWLKIIGLW